jgi:hypothetical protein
VVHHSPHPEKIVETIRRDFTGPETRLKLMVYNRRSWKVAGMILRERGRLWKVPEIVAKHSEAQTGCPVTYSYTSRSVSSLLGDYFEIEKVRTAHIFPYRVDRYVNYEYKKHWCFELMPRSLFRALELTLGWHLLVDAKAK